MPPATKDPRYYPDLKINLIKNPNRLYAFPILGILIKIILLLPVVIWFIILGFASIVINLIINPFVVLFTGKYWTVAYNFYLGLMRLSTKFYFYIAGITDKYPGFSFSINDELFSLDMPMPTNPNRLYAIPLIGGFIRIILLIPFLIFEYAIQNASILGIVISSFWVLFQERYPETAYEITADFTRLNLASSAYLTGLSDTYPSFYISMNHQTLKLFLIIFGSSSIFSNRS